jgi:hypothetical protein
MSCLICPVLGLDRSQSRLQRFHRGGELRHVGVVGSRGRIDHEGGAAGQKGCPAHERGLSTWGAHEAVSCDAVPQHFVRLACLGGLAIGVNGILRGTARNETNPNLSAFSATTERRRGRTRFKNA